MMSVTRNLQKQPTIRSIAQMNAVVWQQTSAQWKDTMREGLLSLDLLDTVKSARLS